MRKIAVALSKGGTAKSTTAVNLSAGLARSGHRTLLVDLDTQGHVADMVGIIPERGLADLIMEEANPAQCLTQAQTSLYLLASGEKLAQATAMLSRRQFGAEHAVSEALMSFEDQFEYVILDTAPAWDVLAIAAMFYAIEILAPVSLETLSLQGLRDFMKRIKSVQRYHPTLQLRYVLPTFYDRRTRQSDELLAKMQEHFPGLICDPIRYNVRLSEAPAYRQSIFDYAPRSAGAKDYQRLVERVERDGQEKTT